MNDEKTGHRVSGYNQRQQQKTESDCILSPTSMMIIMVTVINQQMNK